jgi:CHASE2 domain-containing sensor protein/signal transduction histidine kinase
LLKGRLFLEWSAIALIVSLLVIAAVTKGFTRRFDNLVYDIAATWRAAPAPDDILIIAIDNQSLAKMGKWQWPRSVHTALLDRLAQVQPKAIAYDVLFTERADKAADTALAAAIRRADNVALPLLYDVPGMNGASHDLFLPVPPLAAAAKGLGTVNVLFDVDGLVRRAQLETRLGTERWAHLTETTFRIATGAHSKTYAALKNEPTQSQDDDRGAVMIPFLPEGAFRSVAFSSVIAGEVPPVFFKDKIILIGATAPGLGDRYPVPGPAGSTMSGIEVQANMLSGLIHNRFVYDAPKWLTIAGALLPIWALMGSFLRLRPGHNLLLSLLLITSVCVFALAGLVWFGMWVPPGPALLGLILVYPLWGWRRLEALSSFVGRQALLLKAEPGMVAMPAVKRLAKPAYGLDSVALEAAELGSVIGAMRGIQRFMGDVLTGFPDPVCIVDGQQQVMLANAAARQLLGHDIDGVALPHILSQLQCAQSDQPDELSLLDGRTFLVRQAPLSDMGQQGGGAIIRFADISRLIDADKAREQVLEFLSHDMRTPQAAIISLLDHAKAESVDEKLRQRLNGYARQTLKLADDFVQRARFESVKELTEDVNIGAAMIEAIDICWPYAQQQLIKINSSGLDQEAFVCGDQSALVRAFTNLIDNAVKYAPPGSVVVCRLEVSAKALCSIADQGPGIGPERLANIFAIYGSRSSQKVPGAGLGLAFVKTIVDRHKGSITCTSSAETGTRFELKFPLLDQEG